MNADDARAELKIPEVSFDELLEDPHGVYRKYRPLTPVIRVGQNHYVLRGKDVLDLHRDKRLMQFESDMMCHRGYPAEGNMWTIFSQTVLMSNGKLHARRRAPAVDAFSRRVVAKLTTHIGKEARKLAAGLPRGRAFDLVEEFASPLTGRIIAHIVGLDPDNWRQFAEFVYTITTGLTPPFPADRWPEIEDSAGQFLSYIAKAVEDRRSDPQDDFLTAYIDAADEAGEMSPEELLVQLAGIVIAGSDTTRAGIAVTAGQLLEQRARWDAVKADRSLIDPAIAEAMRLEPPVGGSPRMTRAPIEIDGITIPEGVPVDLLAISAMRDPELFDRPEEFDLHRKDHLKYHMVFGGGVHRCLGEQLALAELHESLAALLDLAPQLELAEARSPLQGFTAVRIVPPLMVRQDDLEMSGAESASAQLAREG